jgi:hypothetical protein
VRSNALDYHGINASTDANFAGGTDGWASGVRMLLTTPSECLRDLIQEDCYLSHRTRPRKGTVEESQYISNLRSISFRTLPA